MPTRLKNVRFINHGSCWQSQYFTANGRWSFRRFQAVAVCFEHPTHGRCLIDTGYGPSYLRATAGFPARLARWLLPVDRKSAAFSMAGDFSRQLGISLDQIKFVFISHFHGDHIGGLDLLPHCQVVYRSAMLTQLKTLSHRQQLTHGFFSELIPSDLDSRTIPIDEADWRPDVLQDCEWACYPRFDAGRATEQALQAIDFWGDGSLVLFDAPGHAMGHMGFLLNTHPRPIVYAVDAFWMRMDGLGSGSCLVSAQPAAQLSGIPIDPAQTVGVALPHGR